MNKNGYQVTVPAPYTGVVFLLCWVYLTFYANTAGIDSAAPITLMSSGYTVSVVAMVITLLLGAFAPIDRATMLTSRLSKLAIGVLLPIGSALLIVGGIESSMVLTACGGVVTGIFSALMSLQWAFAYQRVGLRVAANSFPMLMAIAVGLCVTLLYLPREALLTATILLPIVSEILFHEVRKRPWPQFEDEPADLQDRPINFILLLLPIAVYALATGFLDFSSADNGYTFAFYAFGAFIPVAIAGVFAFLVERDSFVGAFAVPLAVLVAVCVPFLALPNLTPFAPFISIGELGIEVLFFIVAVGFAQFFSVDSLKTYALTRVINALFGGIGWYIAATWQPYGQFLHSQMSLIIIFIGVEVLAVCLIIAIVKTRKGLVMEETAVEEPEVQAIANFPVSEIEEDGPLATDNPGQTIDQLCAQFALSQRERDVFALLARGYTSTRIQKELYIAAGTVNYHCRNIYAKLGVHSKQELIELVEKMGCISPP